jgi:hypothetical protein
MLLVRFALLPKNANSLDDGENEEKGGACSDCVGGD